MARCAPHCRSTADGRREGGHRNPFSSVRRHSPARMPPASCSSGHQAREHHAADTTAALKLLDFRARDLRRSSRRRTPKQGIVPLNLASEGVDPWNTVVYLSPEDGARARAWTPGRTCSASASCCTGVVQDYGLALRRGCSRESQRSMDLEPNDSDGACSRAICHLLAVGRSGVAMELHRRAVAIDAARCAGALAAVPRAVPDQAAPTKLSLRARR